MGAPRGARGERWREVRALSVARLLAVTLAGTVALGACGILHVGPTSRQGTAILERAPKPAPVDSTFDGCGPAGSQPDYALNRLKNRVDEGAYVPVPFDVMAKLPWPVWAGYRFRNQWSRRERRAVKKYEGAAITIEGYLIDYRLEVPEPPNCYAHDERHEDFHIWLAPRPGEGRAASIIVELTPRVRVSHPEWTAENLAALREARVPVRVSGWLMLDQMHPEHVERNRVTLWEVHPVMQLEWKTPAGAWVSLDRSPLRAAANH